MLVIFDVDGTLIGGESIDWRCFDEAFSNATGFPFPEDHFSRIEEVTARAIVHQAIPKATPEQLQKTERLVRREFLKRLQSAHARDPAAFQATDGAVEVLQFLEEQDGLDIAIATGDWEETISFKLGAAGIDISRYPLATSSDCFARSDIIRLAAQRAGYPLEKTVYIGDGIWDFQATCRLGIPFLGVGRRHRQFLEHGVTHILPGLEPAGFRDWFYRFRQTMDPPCSEIGGSEK